MSRLATFFKVIRAYVPSFIALSRGTPCDAYEKTKPDEAASGRVGNDNSFTCCRHVLTGEPASSVVPLICLIPVFQRLWRLGIVRIIHSRPIQGDGTIFGFYRHAVISICKAGLAFWDYSLVCGKQRTD